jgi:hypothetical protein
LPLKGGYLRDKQYATSGIKSASYFFGGGVFMKKILCVLASLLAMMLAACAENNGPVNPEKSPPPIGPEDEPVKLNRKQQRVYMEIWGEQGQDPRNAIGYELKDSGVKFFDRYIVLYGGRPIYNDCSTQPKNNEKCRLTGLHLHIHDKMIDHLWGNPDIYKEMKAAGIKLMMGLVPQTGGYVVGLSYEWPDGGDAGWAKLKSMPDQYPFKEDAIEELQRQILAARDKYGFDGVGYDEEYGNNPAYSEGFGEVYVGMAQHGKNIFRFAYELQKKWPGVIQDIYEIRGGLYIPASMVLDGKTVKNTDVFGLSYDATYGGWKANSSANMPRSHYGPASVDLTSGIQNTALPASGQNGIQNRMNDHLLYNYGVVMFYCLRAHSDCAWRVPNYYGSANAPARPEYYLSQISNILFKQDTVYKGKDYPQFYSTDH